MAQKVLSNSIINPSVSQYGCGIQKKLFFVGLEDPKENSKPEKTYPLSSTQHIKFPNLRIFVSYAMNNWYSKLSFIHFQEVGSNGCPSCNLVSNTFGGIQLATLKQPSGSALTGWGQCSIHPHLSDIQGTLV